jgi:hypothetical protein
MSKSLEQLIEDANKNKRVAWNTMPLITNKAKTANLNTLKRLINARPRVGLNSIRHTLKQVYIQRYVANQGKTFENRQLMYNKGDADMQQYLFWGIRIGLQGMFYAEASKIELKPPMKLKVTNILTETGDVFPNVTLEIYEGNKLVTYEECQFTAPWNLVLESGATNNSYQGQGWGTFIRALAIYIARKTGKIKYVNQISKNVRRMRPGKRPPSATIMNRLGLNILPGKDPMNSTLEFRGVNINRARVNNIVKNKIIL